MNAQKCLMDGKAQKAYGKLFGRAGLGEKCQWVSVEWLIGLCSGPAGAEGLPPRKEGDPFAVICGSRDGLARVERGGPELLDCLQKGIWHVPAFAVLKETCELEPLGCAGVKVAMWAQAPSCALGIYAPLELKRPEDLLPGCPCFSNPETGRRERQRAKPAEARPQEEGGQAGD